jgi:8-oxo-dGTP pyrophosphatase MutT (NUDIX family)
MRPAIRLQYGALPYRFTPAAALEILIVTTRQSKRWIIPKGWPIKGLTPAKAAAREAYEEAGVRGKISARPIGSFRYNKMPAENGAHALCEVRVFPLLVRRQSAAWPEAQQRLTQWVDPERATSLVSEQALRSLIVAFAKRAAAVATKAMS